MIHAEYIERRFELDNCWLAFRLHPTGSITGHFKAYDNQRYHNTSNLTLKGERVENFDELLSNLLKRSWHDDMKEEALKTIALLHKIRLII